MQLKKLSDDHYIVVSDGPIKEGDYGYAKLSNQIFENVNPNLNSPDKVKITHSTQPLDIDIHGFGYWTINIIPLKLPYIKSLVGEDATRDVWEVEIINEQLKLK